MKKPIYITTTLPYVNSDPHIGFAMELIRADVMTRYYKILGHEVFFNTGTDEHGQKLFLDAKKANQDTKEYVDFYAEKFRKLKEPLGIINDIHFIRTTDEHHMKSAQKMWQIVSDKGFIYKKNYEVKYCIGCELEKTDSELVDGHCPIHPNYEIEFRSEENYFFALSKVSNQLKDLYDKNSKLIIPEFRFNEMKAFLSRGLQDFSISRPTEKMPWGISVPGDDKHVMYVWFDALTNYISTLGWPEDKDGNFEKYWLGGKKIQFCGKDNTRQQSMMWQAMLLVAGIPNTDHVVINGFLNGPDGQKMSKSLGNVINPFDVVDILDTDALRFYLVHDVKPFDDSPISIEMIKDSYTANLVNGLGNLTNRILKMVISNDIKVDLKTVEEIWIDPSLGEYHEAFANFDSNKALSIVVNTIKQMDGFITKEEPFKKIKIDAVSATKDLQILLEQLFWVAVVIEPFMPDTSEKMISAIQSRKMPETPLFPRLG